jgi:hypothetical protein
MGLLLEELWARGLDIQYCGAKVDTAELYVSRRQILLLEMLVCMLTYLRTTM